MLTQEKLQLSSVYEMQHCNAYGTEGRLENPLTLVSIQKDLTPFALKLHVEDASISSGLH